VACRLAAAVAGALAATVWAATPGTDLVVPAVARTGPWVSDLYLLNLSEEDAAVRIYWLERGQANPAPRFLDVTLAPGETRILEDVVRTGFGLDRGRGALRITSSQRIVANALIFARDGDATYGQGLEGVPSDAATRAGGATQVVGLTASAAYRTNLYALAGAEGAVVELELRSPLGEELADGRLELAAWQPILEPITGLLGISGFGQATLWIRVTAGSAVVGASRVDNLSSDPTTLESWIDDDNRQLAAGTYYGELLAAAPSGAGGIALLIDGGERVAGIELSFPAERCPVLFAAGQDLSAEPLPLATLSAGHSFTSSYPGGGSMAWWLRLDRRPTGPGLVGSLAAFGAGWSGELAGCNGEHSGVPVEIGVRR
jgi:hypothetical protein